LGSGMRRFILRLRATEECSTFDLLEG